jgi:hypothetical protein
MDRLPGAHTALGYVDLVSMMVAVRQALESSGPGVELPDSSSVTGALAFSAEAVGDGIAVHLTGPAGPVRAHPDARALLDALPGDTIIGGALPGLQPESSTGTKLNSALQGMLRESGALGSSGRDGDDALAMLGSQLDAITDGLTALLAGQTLTFAVTGLGTSPSGLLDVQAADPAAADSISSAITRLVDNTDGAGDQVKIDRQGDTVRIRMGQPGSGRLADRPLYRQAMSGAASHPEAAFYLDLTLIDPDGGRPVDPVKGRGGHGTPPGQPRERAAAHHHRLTTRRRGGPCHGSCSRAAQASTARSAKPASDRSTRRPTRSPTTPPSSASRIRALRPRACRAASANALCSRG